MSIRVLVRDHPNRAIALVTASHALIFRYTTTASDAVHNGSHASLPSSAPPRCMAEFSRLDQVDLAEYRTLSPRPVHGTLGLITVENEVFICIVTGASKVANVRPNETVERIYATQFYCLSSTKYDDVVSDGSNLSGYDRNEEDDYSYGHNLSQRDTPIEHPCVDLTKMLSNGSFYYSTDFDLTNRLQDRSVESTAFDIDNLDESFLWNSYMIAPLVKFRSELLDHERAELDASRILTSAIRGFVLTMTLPTSSAPIKTPNSGLPSLLTLISRLSCRRAGTRFNSRGIDDDGNVANFVETETIYWSPAGVCFSYAQTRGSVPVFWEQQPGLLPGKQNITLTRSKEGTQPAFDRHFEALEDSYSSVHVINLLSESKPGEADLTQRYRYGVRHCSVNNRAADHQLLKETEFDFHAETKGPGGFEAASIIGHLIKKDADAFAYYLSEDLEDALDSDPSGEKPQRRSIVVLQQEGVFRTNCLDCLDRTNLIQTIISKMAAESFLDQRRERATSDFWMRHSSLWADNGDALSKIYAGTGALKTSFTRSGKMSLAGAIADARKSATRLYINNFADKGRQNTIDVLLGRLVGQRPVYLYDPINEYVNSELARRLPEYSSTHVINIWVGTYNVNGRSDGINEDLRPWLFPDGTPGPQPEMVVVGFQEIVELSPQQIMNSDPTRKKGWEAAVKKHLNEHMEACGSEDRYVRLRSGQLVGAALCIYVKSSVLHLVKHVEGSTKKTGLSGMAGNKGAVAIRMEYANTSICFVTAHLAAGFANYDERNKDFHTIHQGLKFQRNRVISDHDTIIWLGDFNYRIGMSHDRVTALVKSRDLSTLYDNDQLNIQMVAGLAFPHYSESMLTFLPTYKFDLGTNTYDTSEKARIPAWTDRILWRGANARQIAYHSADLRYSDHRPVFATFECTVSLIDAAARAALSAHLFARRRAADSSRPHSLSGRTDADSSDEEDTPYDPVEPGLPPASSDRRKWWIDAGHPARSAITPPREGMLPNPARKSNPWASKEGGGEWAHIETPARAPGVRDPAGGGGRKPLPPPYGGTETPPPPTPARPREESQGQRPGSSSSSQRRAAPPVARKPAHLALGSPGSGTPQTLVRRRSVGEGGKGGGAGEEGYWA
ncbi:Inositol-1,4,5-trisphosphate 5-phosphatase 1 [Pseudogymnoascus australis]